MTDIHIARVFTDQNGEFGNPVGIIIDTENKISKEKRQRIAEANGFSETVFINNLEERNISIYSSQREIPFAGHAVVGTAYFLKQELKRPVTELQLIKGVIKTWEENGLTWVRGELAIAPPWNYEKLASASAIEKLSLKETSSKEHTVVWAWIDENKGTIRARTFATDWGIPEDEANGSGSMKLAASLGRNLVIHHGKGSVIHTRPSKPGYSEVGGLVKIIEKKRL